MSIETAAVRDFFEQYARSRSAGDIDLIASQYPDAFMIAGPKGARVAEKAKVVAAFPKGREFLQALGHQATTVRSVTESRLDDHYLLIRAQFAWRFEKPAALPVEVLVDSTFILFINQGALTIVFQQEHQDFQEALQSHGVLSPAT